MMKFLADRTTGKLARKLRALGFDVFYLGAGQLAEAARTASLEGRVLLTRSRRLPEKGTAPQALVLEGDDPREQVREVIEKLNLEPRTDQLFSRCLMCNEKLLSLSKPEVEGRVPEFIYRTYDSFHACPRCARVYWPGTHLRRMKKEFDERNARNNNK
jgi:uncharacterized protein